MLVGTFSENSDETWVEDDIGETSSDDDVEEPSSEDDLEEVCKTDLSNSSNTSLKKCVTFYINSHFIPLRSLINVFYT